MAGSNYPQQFARSPDFAVLATTPPQAFLMVENSDPTSCAQSILGVIPSALRLTWEMRGLRDSAAHGKRSALGRHSIDALIVEGAQNYRSFWPHFDHLVDPRGFGVSENRIFESRDPEKSIPRIRFTIVWVVVGLFWSIRSFLPIFRVFLVIFRYLHGFLLFARTPSIPCYTFLKSA